MLTDTHAHLDFPELQGALEVMFQRAEAAGVKRIIGAATSFYSGYDLKKLLPRFTGLWTTAGILYVNTVEASGDLNLIQSQARHPRTVAIGTIGLDYHSCAPEEDAQFSMEEVARRRFFRKYQHDFFYSQMEIAARLGLNVVIHERGAWEDTLAVLREFTGRTRCVLHDFSHDWPHALEVLELGHLLSFSATVQEMSQAALQAVARQVPDDRFLLESNSPFTAQDQVLPKPSEPADVRSTAEFIAQLRGISLDALAAVTEQTADSFFRFG